MADSWSGNPATWTTGEVVSAAKMNTEIRDRMDALLAGLKGDGSADADVVQAFKTGTLAARPAASQAGRQYATTDTRNVYYDDSANWRHVSGGAYDDFFRADSSSITPSRSGHSWTENSGAWNIVSNALILTGSAPGIALLDTKGLLDRSYQIFGIHTAHSTAASADWGIIVKGVDINNYILAQLTGSALQVTSVIGGATTVLGTIATTPTPSGLYEWTITVAGAAVSVSTSLTGGGILRMGARHANILHANLAGATNIGVRCGNLVESSTMLSLRT